MDTLSTKIKAIKFRAFYSIKFYEKEAPQRIKAVAQSYSFYRPTTLSSLYGTRVNVNRTLRDGVNMAKTSRNKKNNETLVESRYSRKNNIDLDISVLLNKLKQLS